MLILVLSKYCLLLINNLEAKQLNTYKAFYNSKNIEIRAKTSYEAQQIAAKQLKVSSKKEYMISIMLVAIDDKPYIHSTSEI